MGKGIITDIRGNTADVRIECQSACHGCAQREACSLKTGMRFVQLELTNPEEFKIGEEVNISVSSQSQRLSLFFAYILPLIIILTELIILSWMGKSETFNAILTLITLLVYYATLRLLDRWLKKRIKISVSKFSVD